MTNVNQHQMPLRRAIDGAEEVIQSVDDAEIALRQAQLESNPDKLAGAIQQLETAQRAVQKSQGELDAHHNDSNHQELQPIQEQLTQASESIDVASSNTHQPKQVR
jgi:hypothetical protein